MASTTIGNDIFELPAERVALTSFRSAMAGYDLGDPSCWDDLWTTLVNEGGIDLACRISGCLHFFVRAMRATRPEKFNYFPTTCKRACADECLVLSLLSASQHGTNETLKFCLENLSPENQATAELHVATSLLSHGLKSAGLTLLPVPLHVIKSILSNSCRDCAAAKSCPNVH